MIEAQVGCYAEFDDQVRALSDDEIQNQYNACITHIKKDKRQKKNEMRKKLLDELKDNMNKRRADAKKNIKV